jgi:hypothetical protein
MVMVANQTGLEVGHLAGRYPGAIGHLYSPGAERGPWPYLPYSLDNAAYIAAKRNIPWDEDAWRRLLLWSAMSGQRPLWAVVPDVVANRAATLERWHQYVGDVRRYGFRPAFAVQDGMGFDDVPSDDCVLFIGGSTEWKVEAIAPWCARFPGRVHVARVNTAGRLIDCWRAGAVSVDGSGWFHKSPRSNQRADLVKFIRETWAP